MKGFSKFCETLYHRRPSTAAGESFYGLTGRQVVNLCIHYVEDCLKVVNDKRTAELMRKVIAAAKKLDLFDIVTTRREINDYTQNHLSRTGVVNGDLMYTNNVEHSAAGAAISLLLLCELVINDADEQVGEMEVRHAHYCMMSASSAVEEFNRSEGTDRYKKYRDLADQSHTKWQSQTGSDDDERLLAALIEKGIDNEAEMRMLIDASETIDGSLAVTKKDNLYFWPLYRYVKSEDRDELPKLLMPYKVFILDILARRIK